MASLNWIYWSLNQAFHRQASVPFNHILGSEAASSNSTTASLIGIFPSYPVNASKDEFGDSVWCAGQTILAAAALPRKLPSLPEVEFSLFNRSFPANLSFFSKPKGTIMKISLTFFSYQTEDKSM